MSAANTALTDALCKLVARGDYFWAALLGGLARVEDPSMPTIAVAWRRAKDSVTFTGLHLRYNADFVLAQDPAKLPWVLVHEGLHILAEHITRTQQWDLVANVAADLAVNSLIPQLGDSLPGPDGRPFPVQRPALYGYPDGQTFEWYLDRLRQDGAAQDKAAAQGGPGDGSLDDHGQWTDCPGGTELGAAAVKAAARAAEVAAKQMGESLGDKVRALLDSLYRTEALDWRKELQQFPADAEAFDQRQSRSRRNRRFGLDVPGLVAERRRRIAVGLDLSGSIGEEMLAAFWTQVGAMQAAGAEVILLPFDGAVRGVHELNPDEPPPEVTGGGGTCFQPVYDAATELGAVGLVMLTDGENFDQTTEPDYPVLFAIFGNPSHQRPWGRILHVSAEP